jgi:murein DD-endopeptidase MepM/ murein hydrolase activator NlpD
VVSVDHGNGLRTTYEPISPSVHAGDAVFVGQVIGTVANGHSGCPATTCLHWGVKKAAEAEALPDSYLDPLTFMATASAIRLKPWEGEQSHR